MKLRTHTIHCTTTLSVIRLPQNLSLRVVLCAVRSRNSFSSELDPSKSDGWELYHKPHNSIEDKDVRAYLTTWNTLLVTAIKSADAKTCIPDGDISNRPHDTGRSSYRSDFTTSIPFRYWPFLIKSYVRWVFCMLICFFHGICSYSPAELLHFGSRHAVMISHHEIPKLWYGYTTYVPRSAWQYPLATYC